MTFSLVFQKNLKQSSFDQSAFLWSLAPHPIPASGGASKLSGTANSNCMNYWNSAKTRRVSLRLTLSPANTPATRSSRRGMMGSFVIELLSLSLVTTLYYSLACSLSIQKQHTQKIAGLHGKTTEGQKLLWSGSELHGPVHIFIKSNHGFSFFLGCCMCSVIVVLLHCVH